MRLHSCADGKSVDEDTIAFDRGTVQIFSSASVRTYDLVRRKSLRAKNLACLVMDKADEMLNKGFKEKSYDIYRVLPPSTQVFLINATLTMEVLDMP